LVETVYRNPAEIINNKVNPGGSEIVIVGFALQCVTNLYFSLSPGFCELMTIGRSPIVLNAKVRIFSSLTVAVRTLTDDYQLRVVISFQ
jgi:hypothetical protein